MKFLLIGGLLLLSMASASVGRADDCVAKLTGEQHVIYEGLSPANQQMMTNLKMKNGSPATCEFRAGLLDILGNFPPPDRDKALVQLVQKMFVKQN